MKNVISVLSVSGLLLMGSLLIVPAYLYGSVDDRAGQPRSVSVPEPSVLLQLGTWLAVMALASRKSR